MFQQGSPWTRLYVNRNLQAWYAGVHATQSGLQLGEEVLVLDHGNDSAHLVLGSGGFDVLRWNGECVSVAPEEVSRKAPRDARRATIRWQALDGETRDALLADEHVAAAEKNRRRVCKDDIMWGTISKPCTQAVDALTRTIAEAISSGRVSMTVSSAAVKPELKSAKGGT